MVGKKKRQADSDLQLVITIIPYCKLQLSHVFLTHHLAVKVVVCGSNGGVRQMQTCYSAIYKSPNPECVLNIYLKSEYLSVPRSVSAMLAVGYCGCW